MSADDRICRESACPHCGAADTTGPCFGDRVGKARCPQCLGGKLSVFLPGGDYNVASTKEVPCLLCSASATGVPCRHHLECDECFSASFVKALKESHEAALAELRTPSATKVIDFDLTPEQRASLSGVTTEMLDEAAGLPRTTKAPPWLASGTLDAERVPIERKIVPPERTGGKTILSDVLCEVFPTEPRYGQPARTALQNAAMVARALNNSEPRTEYDRPEGCDCDGFTRNTHYSWCSYIKACEAAAKRPAYDQTSEGRRAPVVTNDEARADSGRPGGDPTGRSDAPLTPSSRPGASEEAGTTYDQPKETPCSTSYAVSSAPSGSRSTSSSNGIMKIGDLVCDCGSENGTIHHRTCALAPWLLKLRNGCADNADLVVIDNAETPSSSPACDSDDLQAGGPGLSPEEAFARYGPHDLQGFRDLAATIRRLTIEECDRVCTDLLDETMGNGSMTIGYRDGARECSERIRALRSGCPAKGEP